MTQANPESVDDFFATEEEREALAKAKEPRPEKIDRRVAMAEVTALTFPFLNHIRSIFTPSKRREAKEKGAYPYTDVTHTPEGGGTIRNLGVRHTDADLRIDGKHIAEAINAADVVLMEGGQHDDNYFGKLRTYAAKKGKAVYDIDNKRQFLIEAQHELSLSIPACIGAVGAGDDFKWDGKPEMQITRKGNRRNFLRGVAAVSLAAHLPTYVPNDGAEQYPSHQVSYIVDGRTVKMLKHVREIIPQYRGKNILIITGNTHAMGFEYYAKHRKEFARKRAIYDATYEPVYGLQPKKLS